jgi:hypothetical protein
VWLQLAGAGQRRWQEASERAAQQPAPACAGKLHHALPLSPNPASSPQPADKQSMVGDMMKRTTNH